ncbi:zn-finger domain-containing protein [Gigaspora margarita]|uniref:Zn-finger domain-containing protein n=1 Tax=Gigaspora margarita TaxID=4874 RepID=A0A8H3WZY7_GIGMA|nr:zn-finger domain-containing protein [Gigaspora margarita]
MSFELEDNTFSKNLEVDPNTNVLDEFENISQGYHELSDDISVSADYFEDMQNNSSDNKNQEYNEFPNEAYANLMNGKENIYKEQNNGIWWKTTQSTLPTGAKFLSIIFILMLPIVIYWVKVSFTQYIYYLEIYLHGAEIDRMQNNYWVICQ